jgi:hypothetical protein
VTNEQLIQWLNGLAGCLMNQGMWDEATDEMALAEIIKRLAHQECQHKSRIGEQTGLTGVTTYEVCADCGYRFV